MTSTGETLVAPLKTHGVENIFGIRGCPLPSLRW